MLAHNKLKVYEKALAFGACGEELSAPWGQRPVTVDPFRRAAESVVLNLDLYQRKALPTHLQTTRGSEFLNRILAMLHRF